MLYDLSWFWVCWLIATACLSAVAAYYFKGL
jgi:hypothetical protein